MPSENQVSQKRESLKRHIKAGWYKSLADVLLDDIIGRFLQRLFKSVKPVSFWYSGVVLSLVILAMGALVAIIAGEFSFFTGWQASGVAWVIAVGLAIVLGFKIILHLFLETLSESAIDAIESEKDLGDLQATLEGLFNKRNQLWACLAMGALALFWPLVWQKMGVNFPGWGATLVVVLVFFESGVGVHFPLVALILPARLSHYQFKAYGIDPHSSQVVERLSDTVNKSVLIGAIAGAIFSIGVAFLGALQYTLYVLWMLVIWGIIIVMFANNQYAVTRIIQSAKRKKLYEIQAKIERLEAEGNVADKETLEAINRLVDYHDRIKATRNSALDVRAILNLLNSLLLPLIGFLLGNIKTVLDLLR